MATTSIWAVKERLGGLVSYVGNPEKTEEAERRGRTDAAGKPEADGRELKALIAYAADSGKTGGGGAADDESIEILKQYVTGINCTPATVRVEMTAVKQRYGKDNGITAYHGYQSFAPGECTPAMAHEIGVKLAEELWGSRYQVLVATHLDKAQHLHNHFVVNSVSFLDGKRYHRTNQDYRDMRMVSDRLCKEYSLSTINKPQRRGKHYAEWLAEQEGRPTYRSMMRADVDDAIARARTEKQFYYFLREKGYEIKTGKDITLRQKGRERGLKIARNFGDAYKIEAIRGRILESLYTEYPREGKQIYRFRVRGGRKDQKRKVKGFRALYLYYSYLLGILPKKRNEITPSRLQFLLREDLNKLDQFNRETKLLCQYRIDTAEQLSALKEDIQDKVKGLEGKRKKLRNHSRSVQEDTELGEIRAEISELTAQIRELKGEVKLCDDIAERSGVIKEKIRMIQEERKTEKEENTHEYIR